MSVPALPWCLLLYQAINPASPSSSANNTPLAKAILTATFAAVLTRAVVLEIVVALKGGRLHHLQQWVGGELSWLGRAVHRLSWISVKSGCELFDWICVRHAQWGIEMIWSHVT